MADQTTTPVTLPVVYGCGHTGTVTTQMPPQVAQQQFGKVDCPACTAEWDQ